MPYAINMIFSTLRNYCLLWLFLMSHVIDPIYMQSFSFRADNLDITEHKEGQVPPMPNISQSLIQWRSFKNCLSWGGGGDQKHGLTKTWPKYLVPLILINSADCWPLPRTGSKLLKVGALCQITTTNSRIKKSLKV